jgi:hypothetical protein
MIYTVRRLQHGSADRKHVATERGKQDGRQGGEGIWALQVVWRVSGLMQEPSWPAAPLATRRPCVPDAKTRSAGWLSRLTVASRVAEMKGLRWFFRRDSVVVVPLHPGLHPQAGGCCSNYAL